MHICIQTLSPPSYTSIVSVTCLPMKKYKGNWTINSVKKPNTKHVTSHAHYIFMSNPSCLEVDEMMVELQAKRLPRTKHSFNICKLSLWQFVVSKMIYFKEWLGVWISRFCKNTDISLHYSGGTTNRTSSHNQFLKGTPELFSKNSATNRRCERPRLPSRFKHMLSSSVCGDWTVTGLFSRTPCLT